METDPEISLPQGDVAGLWGRAASRTAAVALVFCCVVLALLLFNASLIKSSDPYNHPELASLVDQLQAADKAHQGADAARLMSSIRDLDRSARSQFFRAHAAARQGWILFLAGMAVFLFSAKAAAVLKRKAPMPVIPAAAPPVFTVSLRNAVIAIVIVTALVLLIASYATPERKTGSIPAKQAHE